MKISPIIHTRLYNCDYSLVIKPTGITNELDLIKKHIFYSNKSMDFLDGERWIVLDNGNYRIAGIVGFLNKICNHCKLSEDLRKKSEKLFKDSKGRSIYGFIGIVIKDFANRENFVPTYDYLWKMFVENISPIFDSPMPKSIDKEFGFDEYNVNSILSSDKYFDIPKESKKFGDKKIFISTAKNDLELFKHFLNSRERNFSFCSNISRIGDISDSIFSVMTINQNSYNELERAEEEAKRRAEEEAKRKVEEEAKRKAEEEAKRKAEEEAKRKAEEEAKKKAEQEAKKKAEEEERKIEEDDRRRKAEREAKRKAEEEARRAREEAEELAERKRRQEESRRAEEEDRRRREERKRRQEAERRRMEEEDSARFRERRRDDNGGNMGCAPSFLLIIGGIALFIGGIVYYFFKEG